jgi:opacity protein-like surface antigen
MRPRVKSFAIATALLTSMPALAAAQESVGDDFWEPSSFSQILPSAAPHAELIGLPGALSAEVFGEEQPASFSIGPAGGYLRVRGADRGTWFGGVQARLHFAQMFAAEAAITFHSNHYENGDVVVTQYPLQLTAFLYIIPEGQIRPYILGGVGWYYTRIDYRGSFALVNKDRTEHIFGEHLGAGAELMLGPRASLDVDFRYIFLNPTTDQVIRRSYNYWQATFGVNVYF